MEGGKLKQSQLAGERSEAKEGERSEAWQEVFLYCSPQTVKKVKQVAEFLKSQKMEKKT